MNRQYNYIAQGFLLMLVVVTGIGICSWMIAGASKPQPIVEEKTHVVTTKAHFSRNSGRGAQLFMDNCATCHRIDKDLTGPALRGVEQRIRDKALLYSWIRNSTAVLKAGDPYFNDLYIKWDKTSMNLFPNLTDQEIDDILAYIR
jgi:cytochrome c2